MESVNLFPTVISSAFLKDISENEIKEYIKFLNEEGWLKDQNNNGYFTKNSMILDNPIFLKLKNNILNLSKKYFKNLGFIDHNFRICDSWGSLINKGESIPPHAHRNSLISGCFYLSSDNSNIYFENPLEEKWLFLMERKERNNNNLKKPQTWTSYSMNPKQKQLILFPSWLRHIIGESKVDGRTSIAFNIIPTGLIGNPTTFINL